MVHLASVANDDQTEKPLVEGMEKLQLKSNSDADDLFTTSVYGSKFASADLPRNVCVFHTKRTTC